MNFFAKLFGKATPAPAPVGPQGIAGEQGPVEDATAAEVEVTLTLKVGLESVAVPFAKANGKQLKELISMYAQILGVDGSRITSFRYAGTVLAPDTVITPEILKAGIENHTITGAIVSEEKAI